MQNLTKDIKLLIFDLDGTLVNSLPDLTDSVNYALTKLNRPNINQKQTEKYIGGGLKELIELSLGRTNEIPFEKARALFMEYYINNYVNKTTFYKDVPEVLNHFSNKMKAVYSNKLHEFTVETIKKLALDKYFVKVMGANPDFYQPKPSSEGIRIILDELNVKPEHTLMIGDSTHDIDAGKAAGTLTCGVTYGYRPKNLLIKAKPNILIDSLKELITKL